MVIVVIIDLRSSGDVTQDKEKQYKRFQYRVYFFSESFHDYSPTNITSDRPSKYTYSFLYLSQIFVVVTALSLLQSL
jgi:hypothetical protein